jgi:hypothetical protein
MPGVFFVVGFGTVGAVVPSRRPSHPVGWLFLAVGLVNVHAALGRLGMAVATVRVEWATRSGSK